MNKKMSTFFLLLLIKTVLTENGSGGESDTDSRPVFISATENKYDPFLDIENKNKQFNSNEKADFEGRHFF